MFPKWSDWHIQYTRKGLIKKRMRQGLAYVSFLAALVGFYQARKDPRRANSLPFLLRRQLKYMMVGFLSLVHRGIALIEKSL